MSLGEKLYKLRTEKNITQSDVAGTLGVSRQAVSKWETDESLPDLDKLVKLADLFEVTTDFLLREEPFSNDGTQDTDFNSGLPMGQNSGAASSSDSGQSFNYSYGADNPSTQVSRRKKKSSRPAVVIGIIILILVMTVPMLLLIAFGSLFYMKTSENVYIETAETSIVSMPNVDMY